MKNNNRNFLIAFVIIIALGGFLLISRDSSKEEKIEKENVQEEVTALTNKTYTNKKYGFSFEHPAEYGVIEYSASQISVGEPTTQGFRSVANFSVFESGSDSIQSFEEFVLDQARFSCSSEDLMCLEIVDLRPFFTSSQIDGQKFSLIAYSQDGAEKITFGPYYTFNMSDRTPGEMSFLMISRPNTMISGGTDTKIIDAIALSLKI